VPPQKKQLICILAQSVTNNKQQTNQKHINIILNQQKSAYPCFIWIEGMWG
jgi:hypothetical protein